ncbi:HK97 family phage major capsid protein [Laceyella sacchari]|uniref:phage major capsid protein n=1 Tax=Laceyella sacchari TaxID=37482 RepID=UPI000A76A289|nr:phage major capsid protein [Laceyella sacchari]TCW35303.1 HK97 family phage major capsid protein [Laceyella sacchari]
MKVVCKYQDKTQEGLMELKTAALFDCGCERCLPLAEQKEYMDLKAEKQIQEAMKAAEYDVEQKMRTLEDGLKRFEELIEKKAEEKMHEKIKEKGWDKKGLLDNPYFVAYMNNEFKYSSRPKNVYANTQFGRDQLSPEMKNFLHYAKTGQFLYKDLSEGTNTAGGYLVPEEFEREVIRKLENDVAIRRAGARIFTMNTNRLEVPVESTRGSGGWVGEGTAYTETDPTFGQIALTPFKYTRLIQSTEELLEDSGINVVEYLSDVFARDFAEAEDKAFLEGTGTNQPTGILNDPNIVENDADDVAFGDKAAGLGAGDIIAHFFSLKAPYRRNAVWVMNSTSAQAIRELKDANNRYLWDISRGGLTEGVAGELLGRPVIITDNISDDATDGNQILFGDFRFYLIGQRRGITIQRSEHYAFNTGLLTFRASMRVDGKVAQPEAFKQLVNAPA